jgi:hypothetical protein
VKQSKVTSWWSTLVFLQYHLAGRRAITYKEGHEPE